MGRTTQRASGASARSALRSALALLAQAGEEITEDLQSLAGQGHGRLSIQSFRNVREFEFKLVLGTVRFAWLQPIAPAEARRGLAVERIPVQRREGNGPRRTHGTDRIQFVGVVDNFGLERLFGVSGFAEAVSQDAIHYSLDSRRLPTLGRQHLAREIRRSFVVAGAGVRGVVLPQGCIVEQHGGSHDVQVGPLRLCDSFGQREYADDMIEIVHGIRAVVPLPGLFEGGHLIRRPGGRRPRPVPDRPRGKG